jgi:hypothetical protein
MLARVFPEGTLDIDALCRGKLRALAMMQVRIRIVGGLWRGSEGGTSPTSSGPRMETSIVMLGL